MIYSYIIATTFIRNVFILIISGRRLKIIWIDKYKLAKTNIGEGKCLYKN